ncbi:hypothetical protein [Brucella intermedia]|uniref:hypothetical protein n=1 Tax=Brucella intermedia TaxID=94625 RepID=UPI00158DB2E8|nr:hypothetical protein [Brucella intermedia]NYD84299.1 hypothetical protein [Brucella intermedia]
MTIPEDIMAIAREVIDSAAFEQFPDGTYPDASYERVARAILAERQRCADVAKSVWKDAQANEQFDAVKAVSLIRCRIDTGAAA